MSKDFQSLVTILDNAVHHGGEFNVNPDMIVMHCTAGDSAESSIEYLNSTADKKASYHYLINRRKDDGILRMTNPKLVAYHAGDSNWPHAKAHNGTSVNPRSIGIAWANKNDGELLTIPQRASALWLCKVYIRRFDIPIENVVGHYEVSPSRKTDPLPAIDMSDFRRQLRAYIG